MSIGGQETFLPNGFSNFRQHYIDILPQVSFSLRKHLSLVTGGNIGFKILDTYNGQETLVPLHKTLDFGILAGFKAHYDRYSLRLIVNQSLTKAPADVFITDNDGNTNQLLEYQNLNVQLTLGFRIFEG